MYQERTYNKDGELRHYGVKGMKWGVRKEYEPVGRKKSKHRQRIEEKYRSKGMSDEEAEKAASKRIRNERIAVGAAAVVAAMAAYKIADSGEFRRLVEKGKAYVRGDGKFTFNRNPELAKDMSANDIFDKVVSRINPGYAGNPDSGIRISDAYKNYVTGRLNNCRRCTFAYEMSRRGFDVQATRTLQGTGQHGGGLYNATHPGSKPMGRLKVIHKILTDSYIAPSIIGTDIHVNPKEQAKSVFNHLSAYPNGSRGEIQALWKFGGGHSLAWEIVNGRPTIYDCQTGSMYDSADSFGTLGKYIKDAYCHRLDNVELNEDFLIKWVKNRE